jgi:CHASE3 domain sensor protein
VHAVTDLAGDKDDEVRQLLREIRDAQREQLAEYRRVTERSLELQERAVARQEQFSRLYRRITAVTGVVIVFVLVLLAFTLTKWWRYLFGF